MKYIIVLCDGAADNGIDALGGQTPLQVARKPYMDALARKGYVGALHTIPEGFSPGSDVANLMILGYDPRESYSGRSPLEAVNMGIPLSDNDTVFRANLVTLSDAPSDYRSRAMIDYSAELIGTDEARILIEALQRELCDKLYDFHAGISFRALLVAHDYLPPYCETPPHDIQGQCIAPHLIGDDALLALQMRAAEILERHPINQQRIAAGKRPANSVWLWAEGHKPSMQDFTERYGVKGAVVSAVDLIKGIGLCAGMSAPHVEGATGDYHTNYNAKARAALELLDTHDFVFVHVEAPDECSHAFMLQEKIHSIERIDEHIVGYLYQKLAGIPYRMLIAPDHATLVERGCHDAQPVPYILYDSRCMMHTALPFDESSVRADNTLADGHLLIRRFLNPS